MKIRSWSGRICCVLAFCSIAAEAGDQLAAEASEIKSQLHLFTSPEDRSRLNELRARMRNGAIDNTTMVVQSSLEEINFNGFISRSDGQQTIFTNDVRNDRLSNSKSTGRDLKTVGSIDFRVDGSRFITLKPGEAYRLEEAE